MSPATSQTIPMPADTTREGASELEITLQVEAITLRPARPSWLTLAELPKAEHDFLNERPSLFGQK